MLPHQTVHIQTLQNSNQPAVSIHFASQLNRFVVNPKTHCIFAEDYPTAVAAAILPGDPLQRAKVRSFAQTIACDIHPLNNLRVLKYLTGTLGIDEDAKLGWYRHWVAEGFGALEAKVGGDTDFCFGSNPTLADVFLVAQMFNARRFECDLEAYPKLVGITDRCEDIDAFRRAHPDHSAK